ncbi:MAG: rod shape-determining protein MreD [Actinomycetota bacterium]
MSAKEIRTLGVLAEVGLPRVAAIGATVLLALTVQTTVLARVTLLGVIPQLVLVVVVILAYLDGENVGMATGFAGGMLQDLLLPPGAITGLYALVYTLVGYGVGVLRQFAPSESVWTPVLTVALASAVVEVSYSLLAIMLGQQWISITDTVRVVGLVVLYNTLLTPFVFPLVKRVADRFRPERVHRW